MMVLSNQGRIDQPCVHVRLVPRVIFYDLLSPLAAYSVHRRALCFPPRTKTGNAVSEIRFDIWKTPARFVLWIPQHREQRSKGNTAIAQ